LRAKGLAVDELAATMATARALRRVLIVDATASGGTPEGRAEFGLRGAVARLSRLQGVHTIAATSKREPAAENALGRGVLSFALLAASDDANGRPLEGKSIEVA